MKIFKFLFYGGLALGFFSPPPAWSQPDPLDSVILESKAVAPDSGTGGVLMVRVWITNKDSLSSFTLPLEERSISGGAYMTLARPRDFSGVVVPLTPTLTLFRTFAGNRYNSTSPDSFIISAFYQPSDLATAESPNSVRKPFWDIKFDTVTVLSSSGVVELDSAQILSNRIGFTKIDSAATKVAVNFIKAMISVSPTSVREAGVGPLPKEYALSQNYPNPFNANTQISFALPKAGNARLDIYNVLGQKVSTLFNEFMNAGSKTVNWDGRDDGGVTVPSGVYFYQLVSQDFRQTKKMLLIK